MHHGGAVLMTQRELQTFFKSPINAFENSLRVVAWRDESKGDSTESATDETDAESEGLP
jgi:hypothetical protein